MKETRNNFKKISKAAIATILILSMASSMIIPITKGDVYYPPGTEIPTYANINVAPNPIGIGQTVNVNFFLTNSIQSGEPPVNMTVKITDPDGNVETIGPFAGDPTGGSHFDFVPDKIGNWTFQGFYGGQVTGFNFFGMGYEGLVQLPSQSGVYTLHVQQEPITQTAYPITPLPTNYWETPVSAQNVQLWYKIMGSWLGTGGSAFAPTGGYNASSAYNPYTPDVLSGHVLWTKPWGPGGIVGGFAGGTEDTGNYWTTRQYEPQYAPVIMDGKMYSTYYPETNAYSAGIIATDLFTGQTLFTIDTDSVLECGMETEWQTPNMYGVVGPYLWTVGNLPEVPADPYTTSWNMFSATTGDYILSVVNGTAAVPNGDDGVLKTDEHGNLIYYYQNFTVGTMNIYDPGEYPFAEPTLKETVDITEGHPVLCCFNMSQALWSSGNSFQWAPTQNSVIDFGLGVMWAKPLPTEINGVPIDPPLHEHFWFSLGSNAIMLYSGTIHDGNVQQPGYLVIGTLDQDTGDVLMCKNFTYPEYQSLLPFSNMYPNIANGYLVIINAVNFKCDAIDLKTGNKVWSTTLTNPNVYDQPGGFTWQGCVNDRLIISGFGGDIWALNVTTGAQLWYTNTTTLMGPSGIETPYGTWPIWTLVQCQIFSNDVAYINTGHEYNPPMFHGAQLLAINLTNGNLVWSELGFYTHGFSIAYGTLLALNSYDNQIYAFGKGPSSITVTAPNIGVTTATPITISGTITDVSAGTKKNLVTSNFPNGVPCVSDDSQSRWMEYVYQQQPLPINTTGVPITISVVDSNGNYREIGHTISVDATWAYTWTPDISGDYQIIASFAGTNSYYPSSATGHFYASDTATPAPTVAQQTGLATTSDLATYLAIVAIAIIIAIAVVGVLLLRKK
ncbi:MAG: hypothetical protein ACQCN6_03470 [Candidatus Bathyarchaeia archaeon]|jgi:hypothetical protein